MKKITASLLLCTIIMGQLNVMMGQKGETLAEMVNRFEQTSGTANALPLADSAYKLAISLSDTNMADYILMNKVACFQQLSMYDSAIIWADKIEPQLRMHNNAGYVYPVIYLRILSYIENGKYQLAMQQAKDLLNEANEVGEITAKIYALECQGLINSEQGRYKEAFDTYTQCLSVIDENEDYGGLESLKLEVATFRIQSAPYLNDKKKAIEVLDNYNGIISNFGKNNSNLADLFVEDYRMMMHICYANIYINLNEVELMHQHIDSAQNIFDKYEIVDMYKAYLDDAWSQYYAAIGRYKEATQHAENASAFYHANKQPKSEIKSLRKKMECLYKAQNYSNIYDIASRILSLNDSLNQQSYSKAVEEYQTMLEVDKLNMETDKLQIEADKLQARQTMWIFIIITILAVSLIVVLMMKRKRESEKQKILSEQKKLLEDEVDRQTKELREQKNEIEHKNRDITDSINYAKRIQTSILPKLENLNGQGITGAFAFFIPCNIVSGDFYWQYSKGDILLFACADCTGHGVPGAFMSMIGTTTLNDLCKHSQVLPSPDELLELLHINVLQVLTQSGDTDSKDGMDIVILEYNTKTHIARIAGARRPAYLYIGGELVECKGNKRSIGERDYSQETMPFTLTEYTMSHGDTAYLCSDGLPDQFGGPTPNGKRLKSSGLIKMLNELVNKPWQGQEAEITKQYYQWRGNCEQFDDISLLGIKF